jgi:hypothetical protein
MVHRTSCEPGSAGVTTNSIGTFGFAVDGPPSGYCGLVTTGGIGLTWNMYCCSSVSMPLPVTPRTNR